MDPRAGNGDEAGDHRGGSAMSGARWSAIGRGALQITRLATTLVLARLLAPEEIGVMAVALVVVAFTEMIQDFGTGQAVIQRQQLGQRLLSSLFALNLALGAGIALVIALGADGIGSLYGRMDELPDVLRWVAAGFVLRASANVHRGLLMRRMAFQRLAVADLTRAGIDGALAMGLALSGFGIWAMVYGHLAGAVSGTLAIWILSRWRPTLRAHWADIREVSGFSLNLTASNLVSFLLTNADSLIITRALGPAAMGYYSIARRLHQPARVLVLVFGGLLNSAFARVQDDHERFRRDFLRAISFIACMTLPVLAGIGVVAEPLVRVALGEKWLPAAPVVVLLVPVTLTLTLMNATLRILFAKGRADWLLWWGIASGALMVAGYLIGVRWGLEGLVLGAWGAIAILLAPTFAVPLRLIELPIGVLWRSLRPYFGATLVMTAAAWGALTGLERLASPPLLVLAGTSAVGAAVYGLLVWWMRPAALGDLVRLLGLQRFAPSLAVEEGPGL